MTEPAGTIKIRIGDREHDKPWVPSCLACTSPFLLQVDTLLSHGWSYKDIAAHLRQMSPRGVRAVPAGVIREHVRHLAAPHLEARRELEEDARARGATAEHGTVPVTAADLARLALRRAYEGLADGSDANVRDAVAALKMQRDIERDETERQLAGTVEQWQAAVREVLWVARKHMGPRWPEFIADLRSSETLRAIMPAREEAAADDDAQAAD